jgi:hypothetical protein
VIKVDRLDGSKYYGASRQVEHFKVIHKAAKRPSSGNERKLDGQGGGQGYISCEHLAVLTTAFS